MRHLLSGVARRDSLENPQYSLSSARIIDMLTGGVTDAGVSMSETESAKQTAVYRAVVLLSGLLGYIPLKAYVPDTDGRTRKDITRDIPLLEEPYPDITIFEWKELMAWHYFLWGNAYALKIRNEVGDKVLGLLPLPPSDITVRRENPTALNPSGKFFTSAVAKFRDYTPFEILHIPGPGYDGVKGLSPVQLAKQALSIGKAAEMYGAKLFGNGTLVGHAVTTDEELEDDDAERLKRRWQERVSGVAHAHELLVLDNGAHLEKLQLTPEDAQFLATREFSVYDIARLYGVPPHLLMVKDATSNWGTGVEVHALQMLTFTLQPHLTRFEQKLTAHGRPAQRGARGSGPGFLPQAGWLEFLADALLRIDAKTRAESYASGIQNGYLLRAEARDKENLPPIEGLDRPLAPVNQREVTDEYDLKGLAEVAKTLHEAGYDAESIAEALGLPDGLKAAPPPPAPAAPGDGGDAPADKPAQDEE